MADGGIIARPPPARQSRRLDTRVNPGYPATVTAFFDMHPYLEAACIVFGTWTVFPLIAFAVLSAGRFLGRAGLTASRAYALAAVFFATAVVGSALSKLSEQQTAVFIAVMGGLGLVALGAGFWSGHAERADGYGMQLSEGLFSLTLSRDRAGVRSRLRPRQGGGRDDSVFRYYGRRRMPNDALEIEMDVPSLGQVRVIARWDGELPAYLPVALREDFSDFIDFTLPPRVERVRGDALASWPGRWLFRESAPGAAARIFGRTAPPVFSGGRLYLQSVEVRDGVLLCRYEKRFITPDAIVDAEEAVSDFAKRLTGRDASQPA
jgi:hypothetical protein